MNDKIKQLLSTAEKVDGISKIKWRIENRDLLRKQRKLELKKLMNNDQQNSIEWLIEKCAYSDLRPELWEIIKQQARKKYNDEIEQSYQDGKEIGTIETLLKNKEHK